MIGAIAASFARSRHDGHRAATSADAALDAALARFVATKGASPGIAVVVQHDATPVLHAFGVADVTTAAPIAATDQMRLASVAKAFSGAAAMSLVGDGTLTFDTTIGATLPDLPDAWAKITLAQLMQHTSGIADFSQTEGFRTALVASLDVAPPPADLLSYVATDPLLFTPGSKYHYSNSDNIIIGLMVAAATGTPYEQALDTLVDAPLGLTATSLPSGVSMSTPSVHGYAIAPLIPPRPIPRRRHRVVRRRVVVGIGWGRVDPERREPVRPWIRGRTEHHGRRPTGPVHVPGRNVRASGARHQSRRSVDLQVSDEVRHGLRTHRQHTGVHAVHRGVLATASGRSRCR